MRASLVRRDLDERVCSDPLFHWGQPNKSEEEAGNEGHGEHSTVLHHRRLLVLILLVRPVEGCYSGRLDLSASVGR